MGTFEDHKVIIAPTLRDVRELKEWLFTQGDMRGFYLNDGTLVIFHSYGNTHTSMINLLGLHREISECLIFRVDPEVWTDAWFTENHPVDDPIIKAIYHPDVPRWTCNDD